MTVSEIHDAIVSAHLYVFKADKPLHVVRTQIRRHCSGFDFPSASMTKYFQMDKDGRFSLLPSPLKEPTQSVEAIRPRKATLLSQLEQLHVVYVDEFKKRLLAQLKKLDPGSFERFCRNFLNAYGFQNMQVTRLSRDGGIDGHGRLKVGFTLFSVAFQCKRYSDSRVGRPEIDQFRGAIQGKFEQGIFFTTSSFTTEAGNCSLQAGAVPIIMINGSNIVDIMIEKQFGVETTGLPVHQASLDLVLADDTSENTRNQLRR